MKINKADYGASGTRKRLLFHWKRGKGHMLPYLWNRVRWHIYPRMGWAGRYPDHIDLELSSGCNMVCPMCYTTRLDFKKAVPAKNMPFEIFKKIVDDAADHGVYSIRISWRGEPTLNPHFIECIRYAKQRGIREVDSLTNALRLTPEMFEEMVHLQMDWLTISFDGTGEAYEKIRKPAKFDDMVAKIRRFSEIKKEHRSLKPVVRIQGIWPAIKEDPDAYFDTFEPIVDEVSVNSLLDYLHVDDDISYVPNFTCPVPFQRLVVGSDGRAFMCINDDNGRVSIGDLKTQSIFEVWNSPTMEGVRDIHKRKRGYKELDPCKVCYQSRLSVKTEHQAGRRKIYLDEMVGRVQVVGK